MPDAPSRRGFLRGGIGALGAALVVSRAHADEVPAEPAAPAAPNIGPGFAATVAVSATVNGAARTFDVGADDAALDVIRERLGLTGSKRGCGHGACGACDHCITGWETL
ncbi:MAG: 2Fe-2S iron-sulfur cluster-binding protein, partial [Myxococcota bacterium]